MQHEQNEASRRRAEAKGRDPPRRSKPGRWPLKCGWRWSLASPFDCERIMVETPNSVVPHRASALRIVARRTAWQLISTTIHHTRGD